MIKKIKKIVNQQSKILKIEQESSSSSSSKQVQEFELKTLLESGKYSAIQIKYISNN